MKSELFFLYYFRYTARMYNDQSELLLDLNKQCGYEKTIDFFKKSKGLHSYSEKRGGKLDTAISNAKHSMDTNSLTTGIIPTPPKRQRRTRSLPFLRIRLCLYCFPCLYPYLSLSLSVFIPQFHHIPFSLIPPLTA